MTNLKLLIIEDEPLAAERLKKMLNTLEPDAEIVATLDSVRAAVKWFLQSESPDLALFDIQLSDGMCFDIFQQTTVKCPVIFTTAYDEYALKAFKLNSVDYLLKPIDEQELKQALSKFKSQYALQPLLPPADTFARITEMLQQWPSGFRSRFLVRLGDRLEPVSVNNILFFYSEEKLTMLLTGDGKKFSVEESLDELEPQLDPQKFFRLNRQYLAAFDAIEDIRTHLNGKLKVKVKNANNHDLYVSRERAAAFKQWLNR